MASVRGISMNSWGKFCFKRENVYCSPGSTGIKARSPVFVGSTMEEFEISENKKETPLICLPGQRLCLQDENTVAGNGTYERQGYVYSTLAGTVHVRKKDNLRIVDVASAGGQTIVPVPGDIVTARIMQVNQRYARCSILCVGEQVLEQAYKGILRKEDVRAAEKDRVEMYKCYRPNDIILARVLPQTELANYQLSTAENELGVVVATATDASSTHTMVPISWTEMQCPETLQKEPRKVAKVLPESALKIEKDVGVFKNEKC